MVEASGVTTGLKTGAGGVSGLVGAIGSGFGATGETVFSIFNRAEEKSSGELGLEGGGITRGL